MDDLPALPPNFAQALLTWYDQHAAALPWRGQQDPYRIWLSEVMAQQTQLATVIPYYERFLAAYPTVQDLATAALDEVLKLWEGLGYYRRARLLHACAQQVARMGGFPSTLEGLLALPGVGRYTAAAIGSMAFGLRAAVLDGNVIRVLARWLDLSDDVTQARVQARLWRIAESALPAERVGDYNQAIMELGQTICTPRQPACSACPLATLGCRALAHNTQAQRPVKAKRTPPPHYQVACGLIRDEAGRLLIAQRPAEGLLGGLWEFPGGKQEADETLEECLARELREELAIEVEVGDHFISVDHAFTHFKITLHAYECRYLRAAPPHDAPQALGCQAWAWVGEDELSRYSFGKADRLVIEALRTRHQRLF
ncbi:MAG: A/G-specific adenine glycosylase [Anaerolineae bacterium]|nr:A/G-specific adenine glycosylase [Anaerolineae bacterium]MDW8172607.1 A/G-specific adenine glycosylase [Anaerolineae bacterium]